MLALILLSLSLAFIATTVASDFSTTIYTTLTTSTTYSLIYTTTDIDLIGGAGSIATQYSTHLATDYQVLPFIYVTTFITEITKTSAITNTEAAATTTSRHTTPSLEGSSTTSAANSTISTPPSTNSPTGLSKSATIAIAVSFTVVVLFLLLLSARYYRHRRHYLAARMLAPRHDAPLHETPIQIRSIPVNANTSSEFFDIQRLKNVVNRPTVFHPEEHPPSHPASILSTVSALEGDGASEIIPSYYMDPPIDPLGTGIISASNTDDAQSDHDLGSIQEHGPSLACLEGGRLPARAYSPSAYSQDDLGRQNHRRGGYDDEV